MAYRLLLWTLAVVVPVYAAALYLSFRAARLAAGLDALIRPVEGGMRTIRLQ